MRIESHLIHALTLWFALWGSHASAQMCQLLQSIDSNHSALIRSIDASTTEAVNPTLRRQLDLVLAEAAEISEFYVRDASLQQALTAYLSEAQDVRTALRLGGTVAAERVARSDHYRHAVNVLGVVGNRYCTENSDVVATADGTYSDTSDALPALSGLPWAVVAPTVLVALTALGAAGIGLSRYQRRKAQQRMRFDCHVPVTLKTRTTSTSTTMIDVSALGAKLVKPDGLDLDGAISLHIGNARYAGKIAWQNMHFAGVLFSRPLPAARVKDWSLRRQTERVAKTTGNTNGAATAKPLSS